MCGKETLLIQIRFAMCGKETLLIQARFTMCGKETLSKGFGFCQSPWLLGEHIKYNAGIRIVYKLIRTKTEMLIIVVGARADNDVYEAAQHRADKHNL